MGFGIETLITMVLVAVVLGFLNGRRNAVKRDDAAFYDMSDGDRQPHKWGYTDTKFVFDDAGGVRVTGDRYPVCGFSMPKFLPFVEDVLGLPITQDRMEKETTHYEVAEPKVEPAYLDALKGGLKGNQVSTDAKERVVHSHGQLSVDEIYRVLYGDMLDRVVDLVVYPESEDDVKHVIDTAKAHDVCLIPYGGGTNVSGALAIPREERRTTVSVDMRRMCRVLWVDEANNLACVEAGIYGKALERELGRKGFTTGHDPDSIELSTLGGWISTNASGMKKNRYGNIEDIVLEATLVTPAGTIETRRTTPRNSTGVQPRSLLFGSEGNFGIITKAVMKVHRLPEAREYGVLVFRDFETGVRFLKELRGTNVMPASIRLVNNTEFRFGQALKPAPGFVKKIESKIQHFVLLTLLRFREHEICASTLVMEGSPDEVRQQKRTLNRLRKKYGAMHGGSSNGKRGYMLTFGIAYIRDFFNQFCLLGETFETSVPWDRIHDVTGAVEKELAAQVAKHGVEGKPYLAYRVTQTYQTGVCIYFTMGFSGKGLDDAIGVYHAIEHDLRQTILDHGGSLSHHHGIGKIRQGFMKQVQTETATAVLRETKRAMDPQNVFGARNGVFGDAE